MGETVLPLLALATALVVEIILLDWLVVPGDEGFSTPPLVLTGTYV